MTGIRLPVNYNELNQLERRIVREDYVRVQNGFCCYCHSLLTGNPPKSVLEKSVRKDLFPANFFRWPVHLHHNHKTGMTIGAVHAYCNAVLLQYHHE
jgi:hypothetical protein